MSTAVDTRATQWAVAVVTGSVLGVRGPQNMTREQAVQAAQQTGTLTITGDHPDTRDRCTLTRVSPVVYWDAEYGVWVLEENDWPLSDVRVARVDGPGR